MKKIISLILVALTVFACFAAAAQEETKSVSPVQSALAEAEKMTWDQLLAKAKEEIGDNELSVYAISTRLDVDTFTKATGIKTKTTVLGTGELYTKFETELEAGVYGADVISTSDSYEMGNCMELGYVENFIPDALKSVIAPENQNPLVATTWNNVIFYNNGNGQLKNYVYNMWQLADPQYKGILMQSPLVNTAFFAWVIEMTKPEWDARIRTAYKNYYGKDWVASEKFAYPAYEWFYGLMMNSTFEAKGGTIYNNTLSGKPGSIGFVAFSKWRSGEIETLTVCAAEGIDGVAGALSPTYMEVASNAKYPYAAALYIWYLNSVEGYGEYYGNDPGGYSSNSQVQISETALSRGDQSLDFWMQSLPAEDPAYVAERYPEVYTMISQWVAEK